MAGPNVLKLSVLANGDVLVNGSAATLAEAREAITNLGKEGGVVWYYRENPSAEPPPVVMELLKRIVELRLPVQLFTSADFSQSAAPLSPMEQMFAAMRMQALQGNLVMLRPDGRPMLLSAKLAAGLPAGALESVEQMLPSQVKRLVAVIADTAWTMALAPDVPSANEAIPFFGLLMGFGAIGHAVWIFDAAAPEALAAGCRDADVLIVDSARLGSLPGDWQAVAATTMRGREVLVHDRATYRLRKI